jgi:hypothetical protein
MRPQNVQYTVQCTVSQPRSKPISKPDYEYLQEETSGAWTGRQEAAGGEREDAHGTAEAAANEQQALDQFGDALLERTGLDERVAREERVRTEAVEEQHLDCARAGRFSMRL